MGQHQIGIDQSVYFLRLGWSELHLRYRREPGEIMASNLPTTRRFKFEDYSGAPQWFATFLQALNLFTDAVYQILDGGVTYQNVVSPQIVVRTITAPASGSTTFNFTNP